jgi:hypothetical protein
MSSRELSTSLKIDIQKEELAEFILNFLGKKEKLRYEDEFTFVLNHNDVEHLYYLINEKISREENIIIEHFEVSVAYQDETVRDINGIEALNKFLETRYVYPISIQLSWNLVVKFPKAQTIENQVIELAFVTNEGYIQTAPSEIKDRVRENNKHGEGKVFLIIHHTNQAWGIEVLNLMKEAINAFRKTKTWQFKVAQKICKLYRPTGVLMIVVGYMFAFIFFAMSLKQDMQENLSEKLYALNNQIESSSPADLTKAMIAIVNMDSGHIKKTAENHISTLALKNMLTEIAHLQEEREETNKGLKISFSLPFVLLVVVYFYSRYVMHYFGSNSHILLTKRANEILEFEKESRSQAQFYSVGAIVFAIVIAIITDWILAFTN